MPLLEKKVPLFVFKTKKFHKEGVQKKFFFSKTRYDIILKITQKLAITNVYESPKFQEKIVRTPKTKNKSTSLSPTFVHIRVFRPRSCSFLLFTNLRDTSVITQIVTTTWTLSVPIITLSNSQTWELFIVECASLWCVTVRVWIFSSTESSFALYHKIREQFCCHTNCNCYVNSLHDNSHIV